MMFMTSPPRVEGQGWLIGATVANGQKRSITEGKVAGDSHGMHLAALSELRVI